MRATLFLSLPHFTAHEAGRPSRVADLVKRGKSLSQSIEKAEKEYQRHKGFAYRYQLNALRKKAEAINIKLARLGYNPDGVRFAREAARPSGRGRGRRRRSYIRGVGSQSGGVRAFTKLLPLIGVEARKSICNGLGDVEDELYDTLGSAVRQRDIYTIDRVTEELKFTVGSERSCRIR
jgi:hypothetical protein